jgi:hypothetical protein
MFMRMTCLVKQTPAVRPSLLDCRTIRAFIFHILLSRRSTEVWAGGILRQSDRM